jgi:SAM-dependent methyltransferase
VHGEGLRVISETDLLWWCSLHKLIDLSHVKSVCDLGQQEFIFTSTPDVCSRITRKFAALCGSPDVDLSGCSSSAEIWRALGKEIVSLDVTGSGTDFRYFDLNKDCVPCEMQGRFDLVTNVGTTEHVLNQLNALKTMHDLTRRGGVMIHAVPTAGFTKHGFFHYTMQLFWRLSAANDYHCRDAWISVDKHSDRLADDVVEFLRGDHGMFAIARSEPDHPVRYFGDLAPGFRSTEGCLYVFLQRTTNAPFRIALDLPDGVEPSESMKRAGV